MDKLIASQLILFHRIFLESLSSCKFTETDDETVRNILNYNTFSYDSIKTLQRSMHLLRFMRNNSLNHNYYLIIIIQELFVYIVSLLYYCY